VLGNMRRLWQVIHLAGLPTLAPGLNGPMVPPPTTFGTEFAPEEFDQAGPQSPPQIPTSFGDGASMGPTMSLKKLASMDGRSTAAHTEMMDPHELDRSLDEMNDFHIRRLRSLVNDYKGNLGEEADLSKSMSEPVARKTPQPQRQSMAAHSEVMDPHDLDRSIDQMNDFEIHRLRNLVNTYKGNLGWEANLSKSLSEPVARATEQPQYSHNKLSGSSSMTSRDARVMAMMGNLMDEVAFTRGMEPASSSLRSMSAGYSSQETPDLMPRRSVRSQMQNVDSLHTFGNASEQSYRNQANRFDSFDDQALYDIKIPQFSSPPVRQQHPEGLSPQRAAEQVAAVARNMPQAPADLSNLEDGTVPSFGSTSHQAGTCKPCLFWYQGLCHKGWRCTFCHIPHDPKEVSRVRPSKKTRNLLQQQHDALMRPSGAE